jgi:hypothetical protein
MRNFEQISHFHLKVVLIVSSRIELFLIRVAIQYIYKDKPSNFTKFRGSHESKTHENFDV